ncbi:T6SS effector amidase Tae4 family protein [Bradyrhizobium yuanmingense]|uniref:T6SS effector amidase Tae4 family protein n=1 Tax=Bradyrhizobium yuanmingense TaxID=108015 RepID=UPI0023B8E9B6|nr:T6SS effector amidase Tae4 family protein [Bradyrhizobium yuanmingense]MDF0495737.1 T6SS effector amidase Tae4 family protein [Bradyrhizobium yuanmingense]
MVTIAVAASGNPADADLDRRASQVGRLAAELGCDLLTGGGFGAMEIVARPFCETPGRTGRSIGVIPGEGVGFAGATLGTMTTYSLAPKDSYSNRWIEVPIYTHLPGTSPKGANSRNFLNRASGDVIVVLPGGPGTQAEFEIAAGLRKPIIAYVGRDDRVGGYSLDGLAPHAEIVDDEAALWDALREKLLPLALPRPTYKKLRGVYNTDPKKIHACSMQFPKTCAIRMSEALAQVVTGIKDKFKTGGVNLCPHDYVRGAEDLAGVLRKAEVFGAYDYGFSNPGSAPSSLNGIQGLIAYINIPGFAGQGHIDLWDGTAPAGDAYWNADPVWFWKLAP